MSPDLHPCQPRSTIDPRPRAGGQQDGLAGPGDTTVVEHPIAGLAGGALAVRRSGRTWILIDPELDPAARRAALTHERIHLQRGALPPARDVPPSWVPVVAREERIVDGEVARCLVPSVALAQAVERWLASGEPVTATVVAQAFETTLEVAAAALGQLATMQRQRVSPPAGC